MSSAGKKKKRKGLQKSIGAGLHQSWKRSSLEERQKKSGCGERRGFDQVELRVVLMLPA